MSGPIALGQFVGGGQGPHTALGRRTLPSAISSSISMRDGANAHD